MRWFFYGAFGLLVVLLALFRLTWLFPIGVIAVTGFIFVSLLRRLIKAPRPYESGATPSVIYRSKTGDSFPSRHSFSAFLIAGCYGALNIWVAVGLMIPAVAVAITRVRLRLHHGRDVIGGALLGLSWSFLGLGITSLFLG